MQQIIVSSKDRKPQDLDVGYGESHLYQGRERVYQVYLSLRADARVEEGDTLRWWDEEGEDSVNDECQLCAGEIVGPDGKWWELCGSRSLKAPKGSWAAAPSLRLAGRVKSLG